MPTPLRGLQIFVKGFEILSATSEWNLITSSATQKAPSRPSANDQNVQNACDGGRYVLRALPFPFICRDRYVLHISVFTLRRHHRKHAPRMHRRTSTSSREESTCGRPAEVYNTEGVGGHHRDLLGTEDDGSLDVTS